MQPTPPLLGETRCPAVLDGVQCSRLLPMDAQPHTGSHQFYFAPLAVRAIGSPSVEERLDAIDKEIRVLWMLVGK